MRTKLLLMMLLLSCRLSAQDLVTQTINRIDRLSDFSKSASALTEIAMVGATKVVAIAEDKKEKMFPYVYTTYEDGLELIIVFNNKNKVLAVKFSPTNTLGLEKILIYLNHKKSKEIDRDDETVMMFTENNKYLIYGIKDFTLILTPLTREQFDNEVNSHFK